MKNVLIFSAVLILLFSGCPVEPSQGNNDQPGGDPVTPGKYNAEFRGEWIRIDNGDRWYISGNTITVNGNNSTLSVTLKRTSDNVASATDGTNEYTLFAARTANASFNAQVVLLDEIGGAITQRSARDIIGNTGRKPPIKVINPKQPDLPPIEVTPNEDTGEFEVEGVIPGDAIEIIPDDTEWEDTTVSLTPGFGENQNMGAIPLTHGDNFKVSIVPLWRSPTEGMTDIYADEIPRQYVLQIENIGTRNSGDVGITSVTWDDIDFSLSEGNVNNLTYSNIPPGERQELFFSLISKSIETEQKNKELKIKLWSYNSVLKQVNDWEDTVSINYYNTAIPFRFRSRKQVQGVVKAKQGKSYYFKTEQAGIANYYSAEVRVPWSTEEYTVAFLGATIESGAATEYSFGVNAFPSTDWTSVSARDFLFEYKPRNESEETAPIIDLTEEGNQTFMGYLAGDSIDYYKVKLGDTPPAHDPDDPDDPDNPVPVSLADLSERLAALPANSADTPATIRLQALAFTNEEPADGMPEGMVGWEEIHDVVQSAGKYIVLDLTDCAADGNTITGSSSQYGNFMNIIQYNQYIKGIILPSSLETVGNYAFYNCSYLESVIIPSSVTSIGNNAFQNSGVTRVTFRRSGLEISSAAFPGNLREAYTAEGEGSYIRTSGSSNEWLKDDGIIAELIERLNNLSGTSAESPGTVKLESGIINNIWGIINSTVQSKGKYVVLDLSDCTATNNTVIGSASPSGNDMNIFQYNPYIKGLILPSTLETIGNNAFYYCQYLTSIVIPASVTTIGNNAFYSSTQIERITFGAGGMDTSAANFYGNLSEAYTAGGQGTYIIISGGSWIKEDSNLAAIMNQLAALNNTSEKNPGKVKLAANNISGMWNAINSIVSSARKYVILDLSDCTFDLNAARGSASPSGNDMNVIQYNSYIKGIILPSNLTAIGNNAFYNCSNLTSINIPAGVTSIGNNAFYGCGNNFTKVTFEAAGVDTSSASFPGNLSEVYASEGAGTYIRIVTGGAYGIYNDTGWVKDDGTAADLTEKLDAIVSTTANNPATVKLSPTNISGNWKIIHAIVSVAQKHVIIDLSDCAATGNTITGADTSNYVSPSGNDMNIISGNEYIKGLVLPSALETIGNYAFSGCGYLTSMVIPESVTVIGERAFYGSENLAKVTFNRSGIDVNAASLPGNLRDVYTAEGKGIYTKAADSENWAKEGGIIGILREQLAAIISSSANNPTTIKLEGINISGIWGEINTVVQNAEQYVILDLADCAAEGNTIVRAESYPPHSNGMNVIKNNQYIKGVILPSTLETIGWQAFSSCAYLTSVTIPAGVTSIGDGAFYGCTGLTEIIIPASVKTIEIQAFRDCSSLISVTIEGSDIDDSYWHSWLPGNLAEVYVGKGIYKRTTGSNNWYIVSTTIPIANKKTTLGLIGTSAVSSNTGVATVKITEGEIVVTPVGTGSAIITVFDSSENRARINITATQAGVVAAIEKFSADTFIEQFAERLAAVSGATESSPAIIKLAIDFTNAASVPQDMIGWGRINDTTQFAGKYVILDLSDCAADGNTVTGGSSPSGNDMNIIKDNQYIKGFILPSALQAIGDYAFRACTYLTSITMPGSVTSIGSSAFDGCSGLTTVTFERIGVNFNYDPFPGNLEEVYAIEGEGTYIRNAGGDAWGKVGGVFAALIKELDTLTGTDANSPATVKLMATNISDKWGIINFTVNSAGKYIILDLTDCTAEGNTVDGYNGAWGDPSGNDMNIIGKNQYMKGVILPSTLETVGGGSFRRCTYLATITIPASVTSIEYYAFEGCTSLASITIPDSVTSIGDYAFGNCSSLITVSFEKSGVSIASNSFPGNLATVYASGGAGLYTRSAGSDSWVQKTNYFFAAFEETLAALSGTSEGNPATIKLMPTNISDKWGKFNDAVKSAEKYVILDLSACTAEGNTVTGGGGLRDPTGNDMNIINDNQYIKGVILPQNLESVGNYAFQVCSYLTSVTIPDGVTSIEGSAFYMCESLTSITIPDSVTEIGGGAFYNCPSLITFTFEKGGVELNPKKWNYQVFDGDLSTVYEAGGAGTYTRTAGSYTWVKQP